VRHGGALQLVLPVVLYTDPGGITRMGPVLTSCPKPRGARDSGAHLPATESLKKFWQTVGRAVQAEARI